MINLIPPASKKKLRIEYWVRVLSVWFFLTAGILVLGVVVLFPAYILIKSQAEIYEAPATIASEEVSGYENVSVELQQSAEQARVAIVEIETISFFDYVTLFDSLHGPEVSINSISISRNAGKTEPISLIGVADNRQNLAAFRDRLLANDLILAVDLPISNLARDKDVNFTITVTLLNNIDV